MGGRGNLEVTDNPELSRYELHEDGQLVGLVDYRLDGDTISMNHAEVARALRGDGRGLVLAERAVADAEARGLRVVGACPFIAAYLRRRERGGS